MKEFEIDLSIADGYVQTPFNILTSVLEKHDLYLENHLYTAIDGARIDLFKKNGTYRSNSIIFAFPRTVLISDEEHPREINSLFDYMQDYGEPGLVIWDRNKFSQKESMYCFEFKDSNNKIDAVEGIAKIIL